MNKFYSKILSLHEWISFLAGIIVTGYVVEISLNNSLNFNHIVTIVCGIAFGFFSFVLLRIHKHFNDQILYYKSNNKSLTKDNAESDSWCYINKTIPKKVFGRFAKFWMPLIICFMPLTLVIGFIFFILGNNNVLTNEESIKNSEKIELLQALDSLNNSREKRYFQENLLLLDSLKITRKKVELQNQLIDSLQNQLIDALKNKKDEKKRK